MRVITQSILLVTGLVWVAAGGPQGQGQEPATKASQTNLPPASEVIARYLKAMGGREAFLKHSSQSAKGKFEFQGQGIKGTMEVVAGKPDKMILTIKLPGLGDMISGYDGKFGFSMSAVTGPMLLEGKALDHMREQSDFYHVLHDPAKYKSIETVATVQFEGQECHQIKLVKLSGDESMEYFDIKTGLMIGTTGPQPSPLGTITVTTVVSDYKKFDDVLIATKVVEKMGGLQQMMSLEAVEFDKVPAEAFDLPPAIKALTEK